VSLHAVDDYPFVPKIDAARWAVPVPAGAKWPVYAEQLQGALGRIPEGCDVLVLSLGYDTLGLDPEAFGRSALGLTPPDFGEMAKMMCETKLAVAVIQEGGYKMGEIPEAAAQFWAAASTAATRAA
jgi:acetoin utilization deacetylase AcuC-like enzyme